MNKKTFSVFANVEKGVDFPAGSNFWRVLSAPAGATLQLKFDDGSVAQAITGSRGKAERSFNGIQVTCDQDAEVVIEWGADGWVVDQTNGALPKPDVHGDTADVTTGNDLVIPAQGYGTAMLLVSAPVNGSSRLKDAYGNDVVFRYTDGRWDSGIIPGGFSGFIIVDLAGYSGLTVQYSGPDTLTVSYTLAVPIHPVNVQLRKYEGDAPGLTIGGVPFAPGAEVVTSIFRNNNNRSVSIQGKFNGGDAGDQILVAVVPVDAQGVVYMGRPSFFAVNLWPGSHDFVARIGIQDTEDYFDVFGEGGGPLSGVHHQPVGGMDYVIVIWNEGATKASNWGIEKFQVFSTRG